LPKKEEIKEEAKQVETPGGMKLHRGKSSLEDEEDPFAVLIKKKGKKSKGVAGAAPSKPKTVKIALGPEDFAIFEKLGFKAPAETGDCPALYDQLLEKKEWLKTAPPKPKKTKVKDELTATKDSDDAKIADAEGSEGAAAAAFDEAADLKKKQEDLARKAAEAAAAEEARVQKAQELEASGKKAAGGLHKFDASEVDVHGGAATADDFMDAFGFDADGGTDDVTVEDDTSIASEIPALASKMVQDIISIQALSSSQVKVALHF